MKLRLVFYQRYQQSFFFLKYAKDKTGLTKASQLIITAIGQLRGWSDTPCFIHRERTRMYVSGEQRVGKSLSDTASIIMHAFYVQKCTFL